MAATFAACGLDFTANNVFVQSKVREEHVFVCCFAVLRLRCTRRSLNTLSSIGFSAASRPWELSSA